MADRGNRPPRSSGPKTVDDLATIFERELKTTNDSIASLAAAVSGRADNENIKDLISDETKHLQDALAELKPRGWQRTFLFLKDWSLLGTAITVPLTLLGGLIALSIRVVSDVREEATFRTQTVDHLNKIDQRLLELRAVATPSKALNDIGNLDQKAFTGAIEALNTVTAGSPNEVKADRGTLKEVALKLIATKPQTVDNYWPTVFQFLSFASGSLSKDVPPAGPPTISLSQFSVNNLQAFLGTISGKVVLLDGVSLENGSFERCRIIFTSNLSTIRRVAFRDCVFEFPLQQIPTQLLQATGRKILSTADLTNFSIGD